MSDVVDLTGVDEEAVGGGEASRDAAHALQAVEEELEEVGVVCALLPVCFD
jgi:predicted GNAT family acetyltransferase